MAGRYGSDQLNKLISVICLVLVILAMILNGTKAASVLWIVGFALLMLVYFRMFSRQTYKRACENQAYLAKTAKVRHFFASQKSIMAQRKTHHIYKCPTCKQKIRVPKGKGRIEIRCPKCNTTFIKKS